VASALHLPIVARTTLASGAAQKDTLVAGIEHLGIGDVTNGALIATIASRDDLTFPDLTADGTRIQGVIGQDVLASLRYTIDYRHRQIVWRPDRSGIPPRATVLALDFQEDRFLALIPADRDVVRLVPDTGAERLVLFRTDRPSSIDVTLTGEPVAVVAMAGARAARTAIVRTLRLGSTTLTNVTAVVVDREHNAPAVDGLLPLHLFARVTFDGPGRQLYIEAR
jgi:hypothetical protein